MPGCLAACLMLAGVAAPASAGTAAPALARAASKGAKGAGDGGKQ